MSSLTPEQLKKIEENRLAALKRRQDKHKQNLSAQQVYQPSSDKITIFNHFAPQTDSANKLIVPNVNSKPNALASFYHSKKIENNKNDNRSFFSNKVLSANQNKNFNNGRDSSLSNSEIIQSLSLQYLRGACYLVSKNRFAIDVPFHSQLIDLFKTVPDKMYDAKERKWNFPLNQYRELMKKVLQFKSQVSITPLPQFVVKTILSNKSKSTDYRSLDISSISHEIRNQLYPFQVEGIQFAISKNGRCLLADDMGLGKTIQALGVADYYKSDWPLLIVCPSSMRYQWEEDVCKYIPDLLLHQIFVMKNGKDYVNESVINVLIVSYDLLGKQSELLKRLRFGVVILDESHSLKSAKSQRTRAALDIVKNISRVILLSGTPALSRPAELFTQLSAIDPSVFLSFKEYGLRYCDGKQTKFGWDFSGSSYMDELRILLETRYMIRRLKKDVIKQLPSKIRQVVVLNSDDVEVQSQSMKAYAHVLKQKHLKAVERRGQLIMYFAETGKTKLKSICDYVGKLLEEDKKFLCFAHHKEVLDGICETILEKNKEYIRIDGRVSTEERKDLCDKFQYEDKYRVAVLSIKAANTGITLTSAQLVVFAELFWNPGELTQAEDRAHRIGQQDSVLVQYLISKNTADDYLWPLVQDKLDVLGKAGLSKDSFSDSNVTSALKTKQREITNYFTFDDEINEESLNELMDNIDDPVEKKIKLT